MLDRGLDSLRIYKKYGAKMAYGSDLLGPKQWRQPEEIQIRAQVFSSYEVVLLATSVSVEILKMSGQLGIIAEGAIADLLVVDGDPTVTEDVGVLGKQGAKKVSFIMEVAPM